jgi:hypothetical protein
MTSNEDNGNSKTSDPKWIKIFATIISLLTVVLGAATWNQNERINSQKNTLDEQQRQLDQAKQQTELKLQLFEKVVTSLEKKDEKRQKVLLVLLNSFETSDQVFIQELRNAITTGTLDQTIRLEGLLQGGDIIHRVGDPKFTDFDIFVCKPALEKDRQKGTFTLLTSMLDTLDKTPKIGRVRARLWKKEDEFSVEQLKERTTIITDKNHPEREQAERIVQEFKSKNLPIPKVDYQYNNGEKSDWLVSIVLCP